MSVFSRCKKSVFFVFSVLLSSVLTTTVPVAAADVDGVTASSPLTVRFQADRDFRNCSSALVRGDPAKGPFTWLDRSDGDCVVPMHGHSQGEMIIVISGTAEIYVRNRKPITLGAGGYYFQPRGQIAAGRFAKGTIDFTSFDGPFDIHYVDSKGKEISQDEAFRRRAKLRHEPN